MSNTAKSFPDFWLIIFVGLRFQLIGIRFRFIGLLRIILLAKSTMSASQSISSLSYRKVSGEHLKTRATDLFVYNLCNFSSKIERYDVDIPKAVLIFLPIVFSHVRRLDASLLLESGFFSVDPQLPRRFPQEDWNQLFSSSYKACKLAIGAKVDEGEPTIPEFSTEIETTSRRGGLHTISRILKGLFKSSKP